MNFSIASVCQIQFSSSIFSNNKNYIINSFFVHFTHYTIHTLTLIVITLFASLTFNLCVCVQLHQSFHFLSLFCSCFFTVSLSHMPNQKSLLTFERLLFVSSFLLSYFVFCNNNYVIDIIHLKYTQLNKSIQ